MDTWIYLAIPFSIAGFAICLYGAIQGIVDAVKRGIVEAVKEESGRAIASEPETSDADETTPA